MSTIQGDFEIYIKGEIIEARQLLLTSLISSIIVVFGLKIFYLYSAELILLLTGIGGIRKTASALDIPTRSRNIAIALVCLAPIVNIVVLAYFLAKINQALLAVDGNFGSRARVGRIRTSPARFHRNGGWPSEVRQLTEWDYAAETIPDSVEPPSVVRARSRLDSALPFIRHTETLSRRGDAFHGVRLAAHPPSADGDQQTAVETLSAGFGVGYDWDSGAGARPVHRGEIDAAGLSVADLHRRAIGNLAALAFDPNQGLRRHSLGITFGLALDARREAALVLLDELWDAELALLTPNGAVVAIPTHDICAFCDAECSAGIAELQDLLTQVSDSGSPLLCGTLLIRKSGRWSRFIHPRNPSLPLS